ncbi:MAG: GNAT family N-acetyltransferase [Chloroflexota bacterium]
MITIRPFEETESDFEALVTIQNAEWPDEPTTLENIKFWEENRNKNYLRQRFLIEKEIDGQTQVIAECGTWESAWSYVPGKYGIGFGIQPEYACQGIEAIMYDHVMDFLNQREPQPKVLNSFMREDRTERVNFFTDRGFEIIMRENESDLIVTDYDFSRFDGAFDKVAANGIEIVTLPELKERFPDWIQRYYDLYIPIDTDVPSPDDLTPQPLEEFAKGFNSPGHLADAHFIALDGDKWVGLSTLNKDNANPKRLWVSITGVLRGHRRKGIATALKLKTIQYAIDYGAEKIQTGNEENNPMYDLNVMLGFKPMPAWLELRKMVEG